MSASTARTARAQKRTSRSGVQENVLRLLRECEAHLYSPRASKPETIERLRYKVTLAIVRLESGNPNALGTERFNRMEAQLARLTEDLFPTEAR